MCSNENMEDESERTPKGRNTKLRWTDGIRKITKEEGVQRKEVQDRRWRMKT